jgi:hypothetical protein
VTPARREAPRESGLPWRVTTRYRLPSIEHVANVLVAGTPPQLVACCRALVAAGMRSFIVQCGQDPAALRLLAEQVVPRLTDPP